MTTNAGRRPRRGYFILMITAILACISNAPEQPAFAGDILLDNDLETTPTVAGWRLGAVGDAGFEGAWEKSDEGERNHYLLIRRGYWQSPPVAVQALRYYRVRFTRKGDGGNYWSVQFFDGEGEPLVADNYDTVYKAAEWTIQDGCLRSPADSATMVVRFHGRPSPLAIDDVAIQRIGWREAAAWCDRVAATAPVVRFQPPERRGERLPNTMATLRRGGRLRIVMLGDSICNDTSNSLYETLIRRRYPQARLRVITSVRGGTGCQYYQDDNRVEAYVLRYRPDLLIVAGISHGYDVQAVRSVIRQVKAKSDCEILVLTGAITPRHLPEQGYLHGSAQKSLGERLDDVAEFARKIGRMAKEEEVEFFDLRAAWDECMLYSCQTQDWFLRDPIHANSRGKQVVGRLLAEYLMPEEGH